MPPTGWRKDPSTGEYAKTTDAPTKRRSTRSTTEPKRPSKAHPLKKKRKTSNVPEASYLTHHPRTAAREVIAAVVGTTPDQQTFTISADLMSKRSGYFRPIITKFQMAGITAPILLPTIRPALFSAYTEWCRQTRDGSGWDIKPATRKLVDTEIGQTRVGIVVKTLVSFWLLGDFLKDAAFQNAAMRQLLRQSRQLAMEYIDVALEVSGLIGLLPLPPAPASNVKWEGNGLQRWCIDLLAPFVTKKYVEEMQWAWSKEFVVALFTRTLEMPAGGRMEMVPTLEGGRGGAYMVKEGG